MADAARLPFAEATFDAAILMHVFAHLAQPQESLREVARVLRPGGRLGILTPNRHFGQAFALIPHWWNGYVPDTTVEQHYTVTEVARLAREADLEITRAELVGHPPLLLPLRAFHERVLVVCTKPTSTGVTFLAAPAS